jgi:hypothetical protein
LLGGILVADFGGCRQENGRRVKVRVGMAFPSPLWAKATDEERSSFAHIFVRIAFEHAP